jgi:hypothetical protein
MTPESLASCGEQTPVDWRSPDPGLLSAAVDGLVGLVESSAGYKGCPTIHSTLWNSMIAPLTVLRVTGFLWYQVLCMLSPLHRRH